MATAEVRSTHTSQCLTRTAPPSPQGMITSLRPSTSKTVSILETPARNLIEVSKAKLVKSGPNYPKIFDRKDKLTTGNQ